MIVVVNYDQHICRHLPAITASNAHSSEYGESWGQELGREPHMRRIGWRVEGGGWRDRRHVGVPGTYCKLTVALVLFEMYF